MTLSFYILAYPAAENTLRNNTKFTYSQPPVQQKDGHANTNKVGAFQGADNRKSMERDNSQKLLLHVKQKQKQKTVLRKIAQPSEVFSLELGLLLFY